MKYLRKWFWFINERFNPLTYAVMIFVFLGAHYVLYLNFIKQDIILGFSDILHLIPLFFATSLFFFKLRLFDEVKDMESDAVNHPERPLPRGLLSKGEVTRIAFIIVAIEVALFSLYEFWAFVSAAVAAGYSLVMYKEFFIKKWLRAHLTTYAVSHTFVVVLISVTIFVSLLGKPLSEIPREFVYFSFAGWFLFNIFEFGRKTFAKCEERKGIDSYSKIFGKLGAVLLVLTMALLGNLLLEKAGTSVIRILFLPLALVGIVGLSYVATENLYFAKAYRSLTSLYIILAYSIITLSVILKF
jgi:4-hydroxybenzoate polyprenyltransferase